MDSEHRKQAHSLMRFPDEDMRVGEAIGELAL
jgi:hypothetical protein